MEYFFYTIICLCMLVLAISSVGRNMQYEHLEQDIQDLQARLDDLESSRNERTSWN